eukprot:GHVU01040810.1.p1 GENE.GHVU01040810.1~~GHVU01040810.1.p1  ORF type:complete len:192 (-),score=16.32 GHVU01040810.1:1343-1918(-)
MSLYGSSPRYCAGAIRNAQMIHVNMPDWNLRFYIEKPRNDGTTKFPAVPQQVVNKLKALGSQIMLVERNNAYMQNFDYYMEAHEGFLFPDNWEATLVEILRKNTPAKCGVVVVLGKERDQDVYFMHSTHIDLFNCIYPFKQNSREEGRQWLRCMYEPAGLYTVLSADSLGKAPADSGVKVASSCDRRHLDR